MVSAGIKLMVLAFIVAVTNPVLAAMHFASQDIKLNELWSAVLTCGAIAFLAWHTPSLAAGLLAGSPSLGAGAIAQNVSAGAMMAAGIAGGMVAMTRSAAGAAVGATGMASRAAGIVAGGASAGAQGGTGPVAPSLGGATKGALVASGAALFRGAASAVSRASAPVTDNFKLGLKVGRMEVEGPGSASPPPWAAAARGSLKGPGA